MLDRRAVLGAGIAWLGGGAALAAMPDIVPLVRRGRHLFVAVTVNGVPLVALLDTGAQMSVLDTSIAAQLRLAAIGPANLRGSGGDALHATFATGVTIAAAGVSFRPAKLVVADLTDIGTRLVRDSVAMILGHDFFESAVLTVDLTRQYISVMPPGAPRPGRRVPLTAAFGIETVPIRIDGKPAQATVDTGNAGRLMLSEAFARRSGLLAPDRRIGTEKGEGLAGSVPRPIVRLNAVEIAGHKVPITDAAVGATAYSTDAILGLDTLRHFRMVCDFRGRAIWFDPA